MELREIDESFDERVRKFTDSSEEVDDDTRMQAYRWNLTIASELICESIPQLALTILNFTQMQKLRDDQVAYDQLKKYGHACRDFSTEDVLPEHCFSAVETATGNTTYERVVDQLNAGNTLFILTAGSSGSSQTRQHRTLAVPPAAPRGGGRSRMAATVRLPLHILSFS